MTSRSALVFIFVTVTINMVGLGIVIPVMPELIMELSGEGISRAAVYSGWLMFFYALMQFLFAPIVSSLSDRFGRRPVLLVSLFVFGIDHLIMAFAPSIAWLILGRLLAGITGATFTTANAYISDVSAPQDRAKNFGLVGAAFGLGFIIGPVIGGVLGEYGPRVPFFASAGLALLNVTYGFVVLRETLRPEARRPFSIRRANPAGTLLAVRHHPALLGLFGVVLLYQTAHFANQSTWTYYTMRKFAWSESEVGYSLGAFGLMIAFVQGGLIRVVIPRLGEPRAVILGFSLMSSAFVGFAFAPSSWILIACIVPWALGEIALPALRGIMANAVPDNAQGELQGALTSMASLAAIFAPLLMTRIFAFFTSEGAPIEFSGAPFLVAAFLTSACVVICWRCRLSRTPTEPGPPHLR